jgi:3'-phosphoadenosine 5'-phosphosulfate sulfotransferase (PAPS reductase)/FAD synthetase
MPFRVIEHLRKETDQVILFHSATGKDSIALLDMLAPFFNRIVCVFMYIVPDIEHINKYIRWAENKYKVEFLQVPHFVLNNYIKVGYLGIKKNKNIRIETLNGIDAKIRAKTGINYSVYGFKMSDSMNRRFMLKDLPMQALNTKTNKVYPLSGWNNGLALKYINQKRLIKPLTYNQKTRSTGFDITDPDLLVWMQQNYPDDLQKVFETFPATKTILFEYEYQNQNQ